MAPHVTNTRQRMLARTAGLRAPSTTVRFGLVRRRRQTLLSERSRRQGALLAPSRVLSVGTSQGATSAAAGGIIFPSVDGAGTNWWIDVTVTDVDPASTPEDPFPAAVIAAVRRPVWSFRADWDRDGYNSPLADLTDIVESLTINRSAVGDLPEEASLIEGTTIAEATVTLTGRFGDTTIFETLAPYRSDSPLYRTDVITTPVTVDLGFITREGPTLLPQLVGNIRTVKPGSGSRTVQIDMLDPAEQLRAPITLPTYGIDRSWYLAGNHKFFVNSQAVIDYVLRKNGIYSSVGTHPYAQISCTGHGWLAAETGRSSIPQGAADPIDDDTWWIQGPFDMLAVRGIWTQSTVIDQFPYQNFFAREPYAPVEGNGFGMGCWVRCGNDMTDLPGGTNRFLFAVIPLTDSDEFFYFLGMSSDGRLRGGHVLNGVTTVVTTIVNTPNQWMYFGIHFQHLPSGVTRMRHRVNGATFFADLTTPSGFASPYVPFLRVVSYMYRDWSNFQLWYDHNPPVGAWPGETPIDEADIDVGLNNLTHLPDVVNRDSWELISEVTAAEYGLCGFTEEGRFFFQARDAATVAVTTVEEDITADRNLIDLVTQTSADSVRNVVTTETSAGFMDFQNVVFESDSATQFDTATGTTVFEVELPYGVVAHSTQALPQILNANWDATDLWGYVAVDYYHPTVEIPLADDLSVTFTMTGDRRGTLTVRNNTIYRVRLATTTGEPALRVQGWKLEPTPVALEYQGRQGSVDVFGPRLFAIGASPWRQLLASMRPVALRLLAQLAYPVPVIDQITAVGNPLRKVGDTIRLTDPGGHGDIKTTLVKLTRRVSSSEGLVDTLTVRPVGPPGVIILGDPEFGVTGNPDLWLAP